MTSTSDSSFAQRRKVETSGRSSIGNTGSISSVIRRQPQHCKCDEVAILRTVKDISSRNFGKKFWGCRNWRHDGDAGCNFFKWFDDDIVDERDLKIARQKKKNGKLKNEVYVLKNELVITQKWLKISTGNFCLLLVVTCGWVAAGLACSFFFLFVEEGAAGLSCWFFLFFEAVLPWADAEACVEAGCLAEAAAGCLAEAAAEAAGCLVAEAAAGCLAEAAAEAAGCLVAEAAAAVG
ncbi:unnamed protein product [Trifolium pratense]|uniref:Uncharacterized protein n=1 Tax=Trifolium pratense TaxID=57577 RepID=A0ACB0IWA0_TRIPR|nr:unnamed protein product [Trifolium pratense]